MSGEMCVSVLNSLLPYAAYHGDGRERRDLRERRELREIRERRDWREFREFRELRELSERREFVNKNICLKRLHRIAS